MHFVYARIRACVLSDALNWNYYYLLCGVRCQHGASTHRHGLWTSAHIVHKTHSKSNEWKICRKNRNKDNIRCNRTTSKRTNSTFVSRQFRSSWPRVARASTQSTISVIANVLETHRKFYILRTEKEKQLKIYDRLYVRGMQRMRTARPDSRIKINCSF